MAKTTSILAPGVKYFTLAGGFQANQGFSVRDSSRYVSKAQGNGSNSFLRIADPGPTDGQLTAVDGFEVTGYSQAIYRDITLTANKFTGNTVTPLARRGPEEQCLVPR